MIRLAATPGSVAGRSVERDTLKDAVGDIPPAIYLFPQPLEVVTQTVRAAALLPGISEQLQRRVYLQEQPEEGE